MKRHGTERVGLTRIRERRLEWIGLGTRRSCASARVCLKKERKIQELKKDAKKLLTTAGLVRDCPSFGHDVLTTRQSSSENTSEISTVEMIASALLIVAYHSVQSTTELLPFALRIMMHTTLSGSVEERNDDRHHRRVTTQSCTSRGILLLAHLRDCGRGELWYQRAPDGRRRSSADCPQHPGARAALPNRDRQQPGLRGGAVGPAQRALRDPQASRSHLGVAGRVLEARLCLDVGPDVAESADCSAAVEQCRLPARPRDRTSTDT